MSSVINDKGMNFKYMFKVKVIKHTMTSKVKGEGGESVGAVKIQTVPFKTVHDVYIQLIQNRDLNANVKSGDLLLLTWGCLSSSHPI